MLRFLREVTDSGFSNPRLEFVTINTEIEEKCRFYLSNGSV